LSNKRNERYKSSELSIVNTSTDDSAQLRSFEFLASLDRVKKAWEEQTKQAKITLRSIVAVGVSSSYFWLWLFLPLLLLLLL